MLRIANRTALSSLAPSPMRALMPMTRGFHLQWNFNWKGYQAEKQLRKDADNEPMSIQKQEALLKQMNTHNPAEVIQRVESGKFINSEQTIREYISALYKEDKLEHLQLSNVVTAPNIVAAGAPGNAFNAPMRVQFVRHKWENYFIVCTLAGILLFVFLTDSSSSPSTLFNVSSAHQKMTAGNVNFSHVMGAEEAKTELQEIVEFLRAPEKFQTAGANLPKGVLMCGPPGTGKTLLARAMAGEAGVNYLYAAGSAFDEVYVGVGSKRVRQLFKEAAEMAPCIVFIDEIDAVGGSRDSGSNKDGTLQQLLTELDGFSAQKGIVVIAATNTPETLDPALVRPGRFDRQVYVSLPDVKGRKQIFDLYLNKVQIDPSVCSEALARATPGFSGADINQLVNASAIKSVMQGAGKITMNIIDEARDDILMGRMRKSVLIDEKTREMTAYHEGGHALVALLTEGADPVHKATIIQRGDALGMVAQLPAGDQLSQSQKQMLARLAVLMGGRAAEDLIYGDMGATSGASSDLMQASNLASKMVKEWGFSEKIGFMFISDHTKVSPQTSQMIDEEIRALLQKQYNYAKKVLVDNRDKLDCLAKALLDKETLSGKEITNLLTKPEPIPAPSHLASPLIIPIAASAVSTTSSLSATLAELTAALSAPLAVPAALSVAAPAHAAALSAAAVAAPATAAAVSAVVSAVPVAASVFASAAAATTSATTTTTKPTLTRLPAQPAVAQHTAKQQ